MILVILLVFFKVLEYETSIEHHFDQFQPPILTIFLFWPLFAGFFDKIIGGFNWLKPAGQLKGVSENFFFLLILAISPSNLHQI